MEVQYNSWVAGSRLDTAAALRQCPDRRLCEFCRM